MYQRSLSLYPGNNGPILNLIYNKLILSKSCLNIAIVGTSVTCGMGNVYWNRGDIIDSFSRYSNYLQIWLNEMFPCHGYNHSVINICHAATNVETFMKKHFINDFGKNNNNKEYDMIIMERSACSFSKLDSIDDTLKFWELYFRSFLNIKSKPVLINLITISRKGYNENNNIPGLFTQIPILTYYQIPTISYYDAYHFLMNYHEQLKNMTLNIKMDKIENK